MKAFNWYYSFGMLICILLANINIAEGAECRKTTSVQDSIKSFDANSAAGGHVWIHVYGVRRPPSASDTQVKDKSMFRSEAEFRTAWTRWVADGNPNPTPKKCGTAGNLKDCVSATKLGITKAYKCTKVENYLCTAYKEFDPVKVAFNYYNSASTKNKWIMNTAYPSENMNCS